LIYFSFGNTKFLELYPIKLLRILEQSLITILANFMNDIKYRLIKFMIRICLRCRFWMLILCLVNNLHILDFSNPFNSDIYVRILELSLISILANFMNDIKYRLINFMIRICLRCRFWMLILCLGNNLHIHDFSTPFKSDRNVRICSVFVAKLALFTTSLVLICS